MADTFATDILPSATGLNLGSPTQRWDLYAQDIDISRSLVLSSSALQQFFATAGYGAGVVYPVAYGAKGDGRAVTSAVANSGSTSLVDTTDSPWEQGDVGKTIVLYAESFQGHVTTIAGFTDSAHITLAAAPSSSGTVIAVWGTDDTAAINAAAAAITAKGSLGHLHFAQGIYLTSGALSFINCQGLIISGEGAANAISLGNYNLNGQRATGTALVWIGSVGSFIGCTGNSGAPPTGVAGATQNCSAAENVMLKVSGQFVVEDIALVAAQRASHCIQVGGPEASSSFSWAINRFSAAYARQYGMVFGGTSADQAINYGTASISNIQLGANGIANTNVAESDPTGGGDIFLRYGSGNYQLRFDTGFIGGAHGLNGNHRIFAYSGNVASFDNVYFGPLASGKYSSFYGKAGLVFTFDNIYDENGYMLHGVSGSYYDLRQVQLRQQLTTNPHFGMVFDTTVPYVRLNNISTAGLPILVDAGARINQDRVEAGSLGPFPAYGKTLTSGAGSLTRSGSTLTLTTTTAHAYAVNDWITLSGIDDATWNGTFKVVTSATPTFTVVNANAVGASTQNGTVGLASGVVASTATGFVPQITHPFVSFLSSSNGSGTLADNISAAATNLANKDAITFIPGSFSGAAGSSLPATITAGRHFADMRGNLFALFGGPFYYGSTANTTSVGINILPTGTAASLDVFAPTAIVPLYVHSADADNVAIAMEAAASGKIRVQSLNSGAAFWETLYDHGATKKMVLGSPSVSYLTLDDTNKKIIVAAGTAGGNFHFLEGTAASGVASYDVLYADSTSHRLVMKNNNTAAAPIVGVVASTSQKSESGADTNVLTYTPPALAGTYRIHFVLSLSAANTATLGWTATWTDSNSNAQTPTNLSLFQSGTAAPALTFTTSSAGNYYGDAIVDINSSAVNIVVKLTFSGTSFTGKASATIERLI